MALRIQDLPVEIISEIFSKLDAKDVASAALTCRKFYEATQIATVWKRLCRRDYGFTCVKELPPGEFYQKILHKYGKLCGLWQRNTYPYGGLVQVKLDQGKVLGIEFIPPKDPNITDPLRRKDIFSVELLANGEVIALCLQGMNDTHKCNISFCEDRESGEDKCILSCQESPDSSAVNLSGPNKDLIKWIREQSDQELSYDYVWLMAKKYVKMKIHNMELTRLQIPQCIPNAIIQPGLFKGTYSLHGLELILVRYKDDGSKVEAVKVTGDPNIPAGCVTFNADLLCPMHLTREQQGTITILSEIAPTKQEECLPVDMFQDQEFCIPFDCVERYRNIPNTCKARFYGYGQIAEHGYKNSSFTPGHWIIFNSNLFGFLWLELSSMSVYHRVQEDLALK